MIEFGNPTNHDLSPSFAVFYSTLPIHLPHQLLDIRFLSYQKNNALKFGNSSGVSQTFTAKFWLIVVYFLGDFLT